MKKIIIAILMFPLLVFAQTNNYNILDNTSVNISGGTIDGTPVGATTPSTGAFTTLSATQNFALTTVENAVTAHAGGGQGSATALLATATFHRILTVATSADSVALPPATIGAMQCVRNDSTSGNGAQVFGTSPDTINGVATATGVALTAGVGVCFVSTAVNTWVSMTPFMQTTGTNTIGVKSNTPTLITPILGAATATSINGNIFTTGSSTYTGTAGQTYTFPAVTSTLAKLAGNTFTAGQNYAPAAGSTDSGSTLYTIYLNAGTRSTTATLMRVSGAVSSDSYFGGPINADALAWGIVGGAENGRIVTSNGHMLLGSATDDAANMLQVTGGIKGTGAVTFSGVTTGTNADFVCMAAGGVLTLQTSACTISSKRFKDQLDASDVDALSMIERLPLAQFTMKPMATKNPDINFGKPQFGLYAEDVAAVDRRLAIYEQDGVTPKSYRQEAVIALLVKGMQEQQNQINFMKWFIVVFLFVWSSIKLVNWRKP